MIDAVDNGRIDILGAVARMREQQAFAAGVEEAHQIATVAVVAGTLDQQIDVERAPVDFFGRGGMADRNAAAVDFKCALISESMDDLRGVEARTSKRIL